MSISPRALMLILCIARDPVTKDNNAMADDESLDFLDKISDCLNKNEYLQNRTIELWKNSTKILDQRLEKLTDSIYIVSISTGLTLAVFLVLFIVLIAVPSTRRRITGISFGRYFGYTMAPTGPAANE